MQNPYQHILNNRSVEDVMSSAARTDETELEKFVKSFSSNEVMQIGSWTFANLRKRGVHAILDRGCLLFLYQMATADDSNHERFAAMIKEMGVSRTQAYREIQVWKRFAKLFVEQPELAHLFVPEALKILSQETTPGSARLEALELAKDGQGIDIREARELLRKHRSAAVLAGKATSVASAGRQTETSGQPRMRRPVTQAKGFIKKVVKLVRRSRKPLPKKEVDAIVRELELAINEIRVGSQA